MLKCRVGLEVFSGKTAHAVMQDFYAKIFMMVMCGVISFPVSERLKNQPAERPRKHAAQINRTNTIGFLRTGWVALWLFEKTEQLLQAMRIVLEKSTDIIRPGRSFKRKHKHKKPPNMNYKQL